MSSAPAPLLSRAALKALIRLVPDFPQKGILFQDITTLLLHPKGLKSCTALLAERYRPDGDHKVDKVLGLDARGFIFGAALAQELQLPFVPVRKRGKLPAPTLKATIVKEYGPPDHLEMHEDAISPGDRCLVVDDLIATGGTLLGCAEMVERAGGVVVELACIAEVDGLREQARTKLGEGRPVWVLL